MFLLERQQWVPTAIGETFEFFSHAENLGRLTPPWLGFEILTPTPIRMATGTLIDYRIKLFGLPIRWRTRIEDWADGIGFVDTQIRGPYEQWIHTHSFESLNKGTLITDRVEYSLPLGVIGRVMHQLFVQSTLARIFDYRYGVIRETLGARRDASRAENAMAPLSF